MSWSPMVSKFVDGGEEPVGLDLTLVRAVLELTMSGTRNSR
ncbi:hypothetical protein [Streptomyces sp. NPDC012510]